MASIGDIVMFRLGLTCQRPLLVVSADGQQISGELFLDWDFDRTEEWITKGYMKSPPNPDRRTVEVRGAMLGDEIGQWRPKAVDSSGAAANAIQVRATLPTMMKADMVGANNVLDATSPTVSGVGKITVVERPPLQKITPIRRGLVK